MPNLAHAETIDGTASVTILQQIQLSQLQQMEFGTLLINGNSDVVTLSAAGTLTATESTSQTGSTIQTGRFSASGSASAAIGISFQDGTLSGSGGSIALTNLVHNGGASPQFDPSGALTFDVGGTLSINENQPVGGYSGTYQVTINYQ